MNCRMNGVEIRNSTSRQKVKLAAEKMRDTRLQNKTKKVNCPYHLKYD